MGSPFGPSGTLRHGLLAYWAARTMTRVVIKPRGVKSREREANSRQQMKCGVAQSRGVVDPEGISLKVMAMGISSQRRGGHT